METKVVLLTGASAGIGKALALQLMENGVKVYAASRRGGTAQKAVNGSGEIIPVHMDVNNESDIAVAISRIVSDNKRLDAVICNAGNGIGGAVEDCSIDEIRYQFETNFFGVVRTIQACLPVFRQQGYGKIMTTSSVAGIVPIPFQAFYSSVKSALLVFMQALALEVKPFGIQCCTILPGDTKTEFTAARQYTVRSANSVYTEKMKISVGKMEKDEQNGMSPDAVAKAMMKQLLSKQMKPVVIPGVQYQLICWLFNRLPVKLRLWAVGQLY